MMMMIPTTTTTTAGRGLVTSRTSRRQALQLPYRFLSSRRRWRSHSSSSVFSSSGGSRGGGSSGDYAFGPSPRLPWSRWATTTTTTGSLWAHNSHDYYHYHNHYYYYCCFSFTAKRFLVTSRDKRHRPTTTTPASASAPLVEESSSSSVSPPVEDKVMETNPDATDRDRETTTTTATAASSLAATESFIQPPPSSSSLHPSSQPPFLWSPSLSQFLHDTSSFMTDASIITTNNIDNNMIHWTHCPDDWTLYEPATPLWQHVLRPLVAVSGRPLSVATFMQLALGHEHYGYYRRAVSVHANSDFDDDDFEEDDFDQEASTSTSPANLILGADFITAPEVSSVFAESIGIWFAAQQEQQQQLVVDNDDDGVVVVDDDPYFQLVELGPGKGSLMADWLRFVWTLSLPTHARDNHDDKHSTNPLGICRCVHLIETSPVLRQRQRERLQQLQEELQNDNDDSGGGGGDNDDNQSRRHRRRLVFQFMNHPEHQTTTTTTTATTTRVPPADSATASLDDKSNNKSNNKSNDNVEEKTIIDIYWHNSWHELVQWQARQHSYLRTYCLGQEFLDALPIYAFEKKDDGSWRERYVDLVVKEDETNDTVATSKDHAASSDSTGTSPSLETTTTTATSPTIKRPRLRIVLAPHVTPALQTLLPVDEHGFIRDGSDQDAPPGSILEVCPEALLLVQDVARLLHAQGGAALFIDYGPDGGGEDGKFIGTGDTLRGYSRHEQVPFLSRPGQVDITADVDFVALKQAVNRMTAEHGNDSIRAYGPITQGQFLMAMGLQERIIRAIEDDQTTDEQAEDLYQAMVRLASPEEMGTRYKVLALARMTSSDRPPAF